MCKNQRTINQFAFMCIGVFVVVMGITCHSYAASLTVDAGTLNREFCPVAVKLPENTQLEPIVTLKNTDEDITLYGSVQDGELTFVLPEMDANSKLTFAVSNESPTALPVKITEVKDKKELAVAIQGKPFTVFNYDEKVFKPYLWPVYGPVVDGKPLEMTRGYPMAKPDLSEDHPHHRSVWTAHGEIQLAGDETVYNAWLERENQTTWQLVRKVIYGGGGGVGWIYAELDWMSPDQKKKILSEQRMYRFYDTPDDYRLFDVIVRVIASEGDTTFLDTKEGGFISIRVNDHLAEIQGGLMTNSEGATTMEQVWGKRALWLDYSGTLTGKKVGIAIMDFGGNFRCPAYWHARDYGLLTANVFGYSHFNEKDPTLDQNGDYTLEKGRSLVFNYRLLIHAGEVGESRIQDRYEDYMRPPTVSWQN